ncbi:MAG: hypothetical protein V2I47_11505 [Bacteroidales bacterium]|nr:hypothetical protein [Bacteroidales bacterium]
MKKLLISFLATLLVSLTAIGQDFFFIGENSYPCTETFTLQSNSDRSFVNDLNVILGKDGSQALFLVSTKTVSTVRISEKLIIYLDDGTVISCIDKGINDNVDDIASSAYYLTNDELAKMKNSNIHKVRYEIRCADCYESPLEGVYSASNKGSSRTDFPAVITMFFSED